MLSHRDTSCLNVVSALLEGRKSTPNAKLSLPFHALRPTITATLPPEVHPP